MLVISDNKLDSFDGELMGAFSCLGAGFLIYSVLAVI